MQYIILALQVVFSGGQFLNVTMQFILVAPQVIVFPFLGDLVDCFLLDHAIYFDATAG